ncbi:MAG TPA: chemotaxis protein CheW [Thermoanaerobaculia bacterium]|jgi:purine-binding chemotaxis protein CheW|nr:chemotaxis protein CheW [Thermoanaerobaculia bacterium]
MVDLVKIRKKARKGDQRSAISDQENVAEPQPAPDPLPTTDNRQPTTAPQPATNNQQPATEPSKLTRFKEEAGRRREVVKSEERGAEAEQRELLTFSIAEEQYALDIEHIVEIVRPRNITRVPNAEESIVGIMSLRGTIVTLVDVRQRLRHGLAGAQTEDTRVIVVDYRGEILGFEVDRVQRVVKIEPGAIEPHPVVHASESEAAIRGVFRQGGALTILLDFDKLLDRGATRAQRAS